MIFPVENATAISPLPVPMKEPTRPRLAAERLASALLKATLEKAKALNIPLTGLLVDCGNPKAEQLYTRLGFKFVNDAAWGGHKMKHLQR